MTISNRVWVMNKHTDSALSDDNLVLKDFPMEEPSEGQIRVKAMYLSLDPTNKVWLAPYFTYVAPIPIGGPMRGFIVGVVDKSRNAGYAVGDYVYGLMSWAEYCNIDPAQTGYMMKLPKDSSVSLEAWIAALTMNGQTAYYGLLVKGRPKAGETVLISGAAGATGLIAGQIAKIAGTRVVGIAGGPEKCRALIDEYGFDAAIDYKNEDVIEAIARTCPNGVDIYFDNIGGQILDAGLTNLAMGARVLICGGIADYGNLGDPSKQHGVKNYFALLMKRATMEGFVIFDFVGSLEHAKCERTLLQWYKEGRVRYRAHVVKGMEHAFPSLSLLFNGGNKGKLLVQICDEVK